MNQFRRFAIALGIPVLLATMVGGAVAFAGSEGGPAPDGSATVLQQQEPEDDAAPDERAAPEREKDRSGGPETDGGEGTDDGEASAEL
jgi:hypothetical protein